MMTITSFFTSLEKGLELHYGTLRGKQLPSIHFINEVTYDISIQLGSHDFSLLILRYYPGQQPYYRAWIEMSQMQNRISYSKGNYFNFISSKLEAEILSMFASFLHAGEKIFVGYDADEETSFGLTYGFPVVSTRLGFLFFQQGFTWFKDWYFPEGSLEGGLKLQGEKPLDLESKHRHYDQMKRELSDYLISASTPNNHYEKNIQKRSRLVLSQLNNDSIE